MADIFDVVADPTRRDVLSLLLASHRSSGSVSKELSVGQIVTRLGITQPAVSKHLRVLRDHGLVVVREDGQHRYYRLDPAPLGELDGWVSPFVGDAGNESNEIGRSTAVASAVASIPGADVGERVGRAVAERSHRARSTIEDARLRVVRRIRLLTGR